MPGMKNQFLRPNILQAFECSAVPNSKITSLYHLIICSAIYHLWRERNDRKFGGSYVSSTTLALKIKSVVLAKILKWKNGHSLMELL
ncbi:hypothetical protein MA16_Dca014507 [Dendrobium catenatum]|uniref:Uncharacterized protein n=1 Tax=Dendrobium catenatum TaxID=906689 RepID=A0A2I0VMN8_9ASPA|nr:hypothetical protein MA16_Dca014507 [Dendrobium catenatum]